MVKGTLNFLKDALMRKFELYRIAGKPDQGLVLERDGTGKYKIARLAYTKDNLFDSVTDIEQRLGVKLEFIEEEFVYDDNIE